MAQKYLKRMKDDKSLRGRLAQAMTTMNSPNMFCILRAIGVDPVDMTKEVAVYVNTLLVGFGYRVFHGLYLPGKL